MLSPYLKLFKNRTFTLFFLGNSVSLIGFGFSFIAVSWVILEATGSTVALGKINALGIFPGLVIALFAGTIIDRTNRKRLLVILDVYRMVFVALIGVLIFLGLFKLWFLYFLVFFMGIGTSLFWSTSSAFLQELVNEDEYLIANSLLSASYQVGSLIGSAMGGFVVHFWGVGTAFILDAATYGLSAVSIGMAYYRPKDYLNKTESILDTFKDGFRFIARRKVLFGYAVSSIFADVAIWGSLAVLTIAFSVDVLKKGSIGFGMMDGAYGVGAFLATFAALWMSKMIRRRYLLLIAYTMAGLMCFLLSSFPILFIAMILFFIMGIHNNSARIISRSLMMEKINNEVMGRIQTIIGVITRSLVIASTLGAGYVAEIYSIESGLKLTAMLFWISAVGVIITRYLRPDFFRGDQIIQEPD